MLLPRKSPVRAAEWIAFPKGQVTVRKALFTCTNPPACWCADPRRDPDTATHDTRALVRFLVH
eukprot:6270607-Pyramimonas_sp.AAC.1